MKKAESSEMSTFKSPKPSDHSDDEDGICKNLLQQQFHPENPNMA